MPEHNTPLRSDLFGKNIDELQSLAKERGWPRFVATQIAEWLYQHHAGTFDEMTNLSKKVRQELQSSFAIGRQNPSDVKTSADGTKKYLFPVQSGGYVEAVYIPDGKRHTLCVSSQVGCRMGCRFCMTGKQGYHSQLTPGEIINQVSSIPERDLITNIVFMGMGEPLDNPDALFASLDILTSQYGFGMSPRRITVSTIGIMPAVKEFLEKSKCHLAISLHSPFDEERQKLVPAEKKHPIKDILNVVKSHDIENQRRVSIEYIVFRDINHSQDHVNALARLLRGIRCRVNLIRFHTIPNSKLQSPNEEELQKFRQALEEKGLLTTIRRSRGKDIDAACGLLSTRKLNPSATTLLRS